MFTGLAVTAVRTRPTPGVTFRGMAVKRAWFSGFAPLQQVAGELETRAFEALQVPRFGQPTHAPAVDLFGSAVVLGIDLVQQVLDRRKVLFRLGIRAELGRQPAAIGHLHPVGRQRAERGGTEIPRRE